MDQLILKNTTNADQPLCSMRCLCLWELVQIQTTNHINYRTIILSVPNLRPTHILLVGSSHRPQRRR